MLVNKFNRFRKSTDLSFIEFKAVMFRDGKWAVTLTAMGNGLFYSLEMADILDLYAQGGFSMRVAAYDGLPYIDMQ